jgi:hypothetical protein
MHAAIAPADDRMHLRLGQAAWHNAQSKTSRHLPRCSRFHAQPDRLQPDPRFRNSPLPAQQNYPEQSTASSDATPTREQPMLFPANFNFKAAVIDVAKLVDRPWCAPSGIDRRCSLRCRTGFFQQTARQTDGLPTRHKRVRACATERKAADCILVMEVAGSCYLPSQAHTKDRI